MKHEARWNTHYALLKQYQKRYGDALVPTNHVEFLDDGSEVNLGSWVSYMRTRYRENKLLSDRVSLLEQVPTWSWGPVRPGPKSRDRLHERNVKILQDRQSGKSLSVIAKEYGVSRQRIHQILKDLS